MHCDLLLNPTPSAKDQASPISQSRLNDLETGRDERAYFLPGLYHHDPEDYGTDKIDRLVYGNPGYYFFPAPLIG